jgi:hypothetical protein
MIVKDQSRQIEANINYYKQDGRNKVGINMFPVGLQYPVPIVTNDTYIPPVMTNPIGISPFMPFSPIPLSPVNIPFMPTVINIPNI